MKNNRCFKWTALLLMTILGISLFLTPALANDEVGWGGLVLPQATLTEKFIESAVITDDNNEIITDLGSADPNKSYVLTLTVKQPANAEENTDILPEDTDKSPMTYALTNMTASTGGNEEVSWEYNSTTKQLVFKWAAGQKTGFTAAVTVTPIYPETLGLNGKAYLITISNDQGVIVPKAKTTSNTTLFADKGTFKLDSEGKYIHAVKDDCLWTFESKGGNWYAIQSNGQYLNINEKVVSLSSTPQALEVKANNGTYTIGYNGYVLDAISGNPANGIQGWKGSSTVKLYPASQMSQNGDLGLGGKDFYIGSPGNDLYSNLLLPTANRVNSAFLDASYMKDVDGNSFIPYGKYEKWHFENAGRNYYYITNGGKYLTLSEGSASLTSTPTKLLVAKNGNAYSIMDDSHNFGSFLTLNSCYDSNNKYIGGAFKGLRLSNQGPDYKLRFYTTANDGWNTDISGYWAIVCSGSGYHAVLNVNYSNGDIQTTKYKTGTEANSVAASDGKTDIPYFHFVKTSTPNWYYVSSTDGKYLQVTGDKVSLVSSATPVYVQNMGNNKIRLTDGGTNAVNVSYFNGNNTLISYSDRGSHETFDLKLVDGKARPGEYEYALYNIAYINGKYYRMEKTKIQVNKSIDEYLEGKEDGKDNVLKASEYIAEEYEFGDITLDGIVYEYRPNDYEPAESETINYYKATLDYVTVVKNKIGGMNNNVPRWLNGEELYSDPNKTSSFHRNYKITLGRQMGVLDQPLMNMLKIDKGNNYYRLKIGTIHAKDALAAPYKYGTAVKESEVTVDSDYDFTNVVINIDGIDYVYSDHVIEGNHRSYFTVKYERVTLQNRVNGDENWYRNPMGFLDGSQVQYTNIENQTVAYHRDYVATLYKGNIPEYGVTISSSLAGKTEVPAGTMVTLTGTPIGFENTEYTIHWERKNPATGEKEVIEGQHSLTYSFPITVETCKYDYYIVLTPKQ